MGMYMTGNITIKSTTVAKYAKLYNLPTPYNTDEQDYSLYLDIKDFRRWDDFARELLLERTTLSWDEHHILNIVGVMREIARDYLDKISCEADTQDFTVLQRLRYFQRASHKFRIWFV